MSLYIGGQQMVDFVVIGSTLYYTAQFYGAGLYKADLVAKTVALKQTVSAYGFYSMCWDGNDTIYIVTTEGSSDGIVAYSISLNTLTFITNALYTASGYHTGPQTPITTDGTNLYIALGYAVWIVPISTGIPKLYAGTTNKQGYQDGVQP
jgi:hypothetical protein